MTHRKKIETVGFFNCQLIKDESCVWFLKDRSNKLMNSNVGWMMGRFCRKSKALSWSIIEINRILKGYFR